MKHIASHRIAFRSRSARRRHRPGLSTPPGGSEPGQDARAGVRPVASIIKEIAAMARFDARTLAAALAAIVLSAHAAKAENYVINPNIPCIPCGIEHPWGKLPPPPLAQIPNFEGPDRRPAVQDRMRPAVPGLPSTHRQRR